MHGSSASLFDHLVGELANYPDLSRNFTRCRSVVLEVARFQSESFDGCLRKPAPGFDLLIRSHHCTDNCCSLLRILFGHEVDRADGRTAP
jgi:hypothetical protein